MNGRRERLTKFRNDLTKAEWTGEVTKMLYTHKAPVEESDVPVIVAYLANLKIGPWEDTGRTE